MYLYLLMVRPIGPVLFGQVGTEKPRPLQRCFAHQAGRIANPNRYSAHVFGTHVLFTPFGDVLVRGNLTHIAVRVSPGFV